MFVDYVFFQDRHYSYPIPEDCLYQVIAAENGIFLRGERSELRAIFPIRGTENLHLPGLLKLDPSIAIIHRVPANMLRDIVSYSRRIFPKEVLFYLFRQSGSWHGIVPEQVITCGSVRPVDPYAHAHALIEIHSHNRMDAVFSPADDRDETGFKIYVVLGRLHEAIPQIRVRVGLYGHFCEIPYELIFKEWEGIRNA